MQEYILYARAYLPVVCAHTVALLGASTWTGTLLVNTWNIEKQDNEANSYSIFQMLSDLSPKYAKRKIEEYCSLKVQRSIRKIFYLINDRVAQLSCGAIALSALQEAIEGIQLSKLHHTLILLICFLSGAIIEGNFITASSTDNTTTSEKNTPQNTRKTKIASHKILAGALSAAALYEKRWLSAVACTYPMWPQQQCGKKHPKARR